jgi:fatty acid desaturase
MDFKEYQSIRDKIKLKRKRSYWILHLLQDVLLIGVVYVLETRLHSQIKIILQIPLLSAIMFRNFSIMHDAVHGAVDNSKILNQIAGNISGALCGLAFEPWKQIHLDHHVWAGNIDHDPSMSLVKTFPSWPSWLKNTLTFMWRAWIPMLAFLQYSVFWTHSLVHYLKKPTSIKMFLSLSLPIIFTTLVFHYSSSLFIMQTLLPSVMLYLLAVEVVNFPHHLELPQLQNEEKLPLWNQHEISRTWIKMMLDMIIEI